MKEDGFRFNISETEWGRRYSGTKDRGALRKPGKTIIFHFEKTNPSPVQFGNFVREAERLCEKDGIDYVVEGIHLWTPSDIDRRKQEFRIFLEKVDKKVKSLIHYKSTDVPVPESSVEAQPSKPMPMNQAARSVQRRLARPSDIDLLLPNKSTKEKTLMVLDTYLEKSGSRTAVLLAITQERGIVFRQVDNQLVQYGLELKWEQVQHVDSEERADGEQVILVNDGRRVHEFVHPQSEDFVRLLGHLKWAREGYRTGYIEEHGFDPDLVGKSKERMLNERYTDAVRDAFALLESRIRYDSFAPATMHGKDLIDHAFSANTGKLNFGRSAPERDGLYMLFAGAFAWLRNPASHTSELRNFGKDDAFEVLALINHLLKLSRRGSEEARNRPT